MNEPGDALEAGLRLAQLEQRGVPYAFGGALAYGQYGIPRATNDVDVNVFVEPAALAPVFDFTPSIPFSWQALDTRVRHHIDDADIWFLSAEALCVFKLLFLRGRDVVDLERLIAVQGGALDGAYVRNQIIAMLADEDPRVATWDKLLTEHQSA